MNLSFQYSLEKKHDLGFAYPQDLLYYLLLYTPPQVTSTSVSLANFSLLAL
jgi:hypothetical protein